jgi:DNA modification methylase
MIATANTRGEGSPPNQCVDHQIAIAICPIDALNPRQNNPRHHSRRQIRQIAKSIQTFGFNVPVLIDAQGNVIAGHGRLQACLELGIKEVPTIRLEHLTEAQARAYTIADNRLTDNSAWDDRLLAQELKELSALDLNFDLDATGFEVAEIDLRIGSLEGNDDDFEDMAGRLSAEDAQPVSHPGDLWLLGKHRLYCGNSLDKSAYRTLMDGKRADMVFADPPYNVPIQGHVSGRGKKRHREFAMASGEMTPKEFIDFLGRAFALMAGHSADGSLHYICMDWRHMPELMTAGRKVYSDPRNLCVWVKSNAGMGSFYRSQHELVFVFKHGAAQHKNNVELGKHGRNRTNVWQYPGSCALNTSSDASLATAHPTVKPIQLVADAIKDCTARGDIVLDPFMGSGTTLLAAERTGRCGYGIELDPGYIDIAIKRWERMSKGRAVHAGSGMPFQEIAPQRGGPQ